MQAAILDQFYSGAAGSELEFELIDELSSVTGALVEVSLARLQWAAALETLRGMHSDLKLLVRRLRELHRNRCDGDAWGDEKAEISAYSAARWVTAAMVQAR